jgi:hypothetical protein
MKVKRAEGFLSVGPFLWSRIILPKIRATG